VEAKQIIPGLSRNENDAVTALGFFVVGMLVLLCTAVLILHLLSGLPDIMTYGILFAMVVFTVVCGAALVSINVPVKRGGPPEIQFRNPPRRAKRQRPRPIA
jgi:hypothetical protein